MGEDGNGDSLISCKTKPCPSLNGMIIQCIIFKFNRKTPDILLSRLFSSVKTTINSQLGLDYFEK